ncbi:hypothetical protein SKAU_G00335060 [Synaphobranchus kaupii]|uniref:Uncharacterized protein n=1 Tax=Synaphobranchus kaupii TaxID=118154 RepID=A0A9Q1EM24_SYNKA|nr:hypothetical protein SKAU_G00335060 [Synaphobranchus kaupii]
MPRAPQISLGPSSRRSPMGRLGSHQDEPVEQTRGAMKEKEKFEGLDPAGLWVEVTCGRPGTWLGIGVNVLCRACPGTRVTGGRALSSDRWWARGGGGGASVRYQRSGSGLLGDDATPRAPPGWRGGSAENLSPLSLGPGHCGRLAGGPRDLGAERRGLGRHCCSRRLLTASAPDVSGSEPNNPPRRCPLRGPLCSTVTRDPGPRRAAGPPRDEERRLY